MEIRLHLDVRHSLEPELMSLARGIFNQLRGIMGLAQDLKDASGALIGAVGGFQVAVDAAEARLTEAIKNAGDPALTQAVTEVIDSLKTAAGTATTAAADLNDGTDEAATAAAGTVAGS